MLDVLFCSPGNHRSRTLSVVGECDSSNQNLLLFVERMSKGKPVHVQLGPRQWELGGEYLKVLEPCNHCLDADDIGAALRKELNDKGYVYLRRVLPEDDVMKARLAGIVRCRQTTKTMMIKHGHDLF